MKERKGEVEKGRSGQEFIVGSGRRGGSGEDGVGSRE